MACRNDKFSFYSIYTMAVARGWAGQALAQPLFRRLNVCVHTLNTCEITHKMAAIIVQKSNVALGFSAVSVYSMTNAFCDKARVAHGRCTQLSSYMKSEITSLFPRPHPDFHRLLLCSASDGKLGGSLGTKTITLCTKFHAICDLHYLTESTCSNY